jgi:hypothetical protein
LIRVKFFSTKILYIKDCFKILKSIFMKFITIKLFSIKSHMKFFSSINLAFLQYSNSLIVAIEKEGL